MTEPRIWFDPPAFSWGRVLRIGALWFALVLALLLPLSMPLDEERPVPRPTEPTGFVAPPAMSALPSASLPVATVMSARVASAPRVVASAAR